MNTIKLKLSLLAIVFLTIFFSANAPAKEDKDDAGKFLAVKNKVLIQRDKDKLFAKAKQGILMQDTVSTMKASMAKMHFNDDSLLTLGENSKVIIKEYVYKKDEGGRSIYNLIDGKMRSIVGKTKFEIHTHTAVAAARGTIILVEAGVLSGVRFTTFMCLEGELEVSSPAPGIEGKRFLKAGMGIKVFENAPLPEPVQVSSKTSRSSSDGKGNTKEAKESKESAVTTGSSETTSQTISQTSSESTQASAESAQSLSEPMQPMSAEIDSLEAATEMDYTAPAPASPEVSAPVITIVDLGLGANKTGAAPPIEQQPGAKSSSINLNIRFP